MTKITIAITGSIAAYKACDIVSELGKLGFDVTVLMTQTAQQFITPLTLQVLSKNPVHTNLITEDRADVVNHIDIAKQTDLFLVAPATADTLARLSHGHAHDIVCAVALALPKHVIKLIAPAMNTNMYDNPLTQANIHTLHTIGYKEIEPKESLLACGDIGKGALANVDDIVKVVQSTLQDIS